MNKSHNVSLLTALLLIAAMIFPVSSFSANPCATADGFLDIGIGRTGHSGDEGDKGIGGTGVMGHNSDIEGIGGTGVIGHNSDIEGIGGTGVIGHNSDIEGIGGTGVIGHDNGIGGTGQLASQGNGELIYVAGTIHAFGSICVNGVEIEYTADTPVSTDTNQKLAASSLEIGQVVDIIAEKKTGKGMPRAKNIAVRFPLQGPVTKISPDKRLIDVMGKSVRLTGPQAEKSIQVGDTIRVSGLQNSQGRIIATFIEKAPKQSPARTMPSKAKVIPSGITELSVQGYVQRKAPGGRVSIEGQRFDLGVSGKDIEIGTRMIVSGKRQRNGAIKAFSWVRERTVAGTRPQFGKMKGSGHQNRNRGRGHGKGDNDTKEDNSGKGHANRPDDNNRMDNSGKGSGKSDRIEKPDHSGSGSGKADRIEKPDHSGSGSGKADRIEKPDHSGSGSGKADRIEKPDHSGSGKNSHPDRIIRPDRSGRLERPVRPDRSGKGRGGG